MMPEHKAIQREQAVHAQQLRTDYFKAGYEAGVKAGIEQVLEEIKRQTGEGANAKNSVQEQSAGHIPIEQVPVEDGVSDRLHAEPVNPEVGQQPA